MSRRTHDDQREEELWQRRQPQPREHEQGRPCPDCVGVGALVIGGAQNVVTCDVCRGTGRLTGAAARRE